MPFITGTAGGVLNSLFHNEPSHYGNVMPGFRLLQSITGSNKEALTSGTPSLQAPSNQGSSLDDQILALQMAAIDARYGGDGGASAAAKSYHPGPAPKLDQYGGPTIDQLNQYANTGRGNIEQSYGNLANFVASQLPVTQDIYNQGGAAQQAAYTKAAQNIQGAIGSGQAALNTPANMAGAGAAAAKEQQKAVADVLARYQSTNAQNQLSAAQRNQANLAMQASNNAIRVAGDQQAGREALLRFVAGTNLQKSQAQLQMDQIAASNKAKMAQYEQQESYKKADIMNRAAAAQEGNAGKAQAAKLDLLAKVLKNQATSGSHLSGVQGVLSFGNQQGNADASNKFLALVASSRADAERQNIAAAADASGRTKRTTAGEMLQQKLLGTVPDINDPKSMIDTIRNTPQLSSLEKYAVWAPQQAYYNPQMAEQLYPGITKNRSGDALNKEIAKRFQQGGPAINITGLKKNTADYQTLQNYISQQMNLNELYNQMYEIYSGKYGSGM